jgi:hypothetical protein
LQGKLNVYSVITRDYLNVLEKEGMNLLSMVFGNSIGMIESRQGKAYDFNFDVTTSDRIVC